MIDNQFPKKFPEVENGNIFMYNNKKIGIASNDRIVLQPKKNLKII